MCCSPCTEFSRAMTSRPRDLSRADKIVRTTLEIVEYLQPQLWFMENPRHGELANREYMKDIPYIDVDYCLFSDWGYQKPTRIWGSNSLKRLQSRVCDRNCPNMEWQQGPTGSKWVHRSKLGCTPDPGKIKPSGVQAGRVPESLILYILSAEPLLAQPKEDDSPAKKSKSDISSPGVLGPGPPEPANPLLPLPSGEGGDLRHAVPPRGWYHRWLLKIIFHQW